MRYLVASVSLCAIFSYACALTPACCMHRQAATLTFFMELLSTPPASPDRALGTGGTAGGTAFSNQGCCCPEIKGQQHTNVSASERGGACDSVTIWSYRRARVGREQNVSYFAINDGNDYVSISLKSTAPVISCVPTVQPGDVSQQNWGNPSGNDLDNAYIFMPLEQARLSVASGV